MLAAVVTLEDALLQAGSHAGAAAWSWEGTCFQSLGGKFLQQVTKGLGLYQYCEHFRESPGQFFLNYSI